MQYVRIDGKELLGEQVMHQDVLEFVVDSIDRIHLPLDIESRDLSGDLLGRRKIDVARYVEIFARKTPPAFSQRIASLFADGQYDDLFRGLFSQEGRGTPDDVGVEGSAQGAVSRQHHNQDFFLRRTEQRVFGRI
jgi:hypothetical protein